MVEGGLLRQHAATSPMLRVLQEGQENLTGRPTMDQNLAVYIYIFLGGMALVGLMSLVIYCYHQRKFQRYVQRDNLNNNMQRHSLVDSFLEAGEVEWVCSVCYHENHPAKKECIMCGAQQVISEQVLVTPRGNGSRLLTSKTRGDQDDDDELFLQAARQRSFHVRRLNQRQRGARRRNLWKRGKGEDGQLRWYRTEDCRPSRVSILSTQTAARPVLEQPSPTAAAAAASSDSQREIVLLESIETELVMSPTGPEARKKAFGIRTGPDGANLSSQISIGFVRHVDEDGNISWIPAEEAQISDLTENDPEEFPRASHLSDFEAVAALPFRQKVRWFLQELDNVGVPWEEGHLLLKIRRDAILQESMHLLMLVPASDIRQKLRIEFLEEPGLDAGGLIREWILLLGQKLFDESYGLFQATHVENLGYWINSSSGILQEEHLKCFEFVGRLLAKCLLEGQLLTVHFALPLLKHILGVPISFSDLEFLDDEVFKNAKWILENNGVDALCLDFTVQQRDLDGKFRTIELKTNGKEIEVTDENKQEYIDLFLRYKMFDSVSDQITALLKGLYSVIPRNLLTVFDYQELELLICGVPHIDVDDWQRHTDNKYQDFENPSKFEKKVVQWFWEVIRQFSQEERARLLQFVTGTSRVPPEGFKALVSNDGRVRRFGIQIVPRGIPPTGLYPKAHTCFNRIDVPLYKTKEELETYLTLVINMEITGFSMQ